MGRPAPRRRSLRSSLRSHAGFALSRTRHQHRCSTPHSHPRRHIRNPMRATLPDLLPSESPLHPRQSARPGTPGPPQPGSVLAKHRRATVSRIRREPRRIPDLAEHRSVAVRPMPIIAVVGLATGQIRIGGGAGCPTRLVNGWPLPKNERLLRQSVRGGDREWGWRGRPGYCRKGPIRGIREPDDGGVGVPTDPTCGAATPRKGRRIRNLEHTDSVRLTGLGPIVKPNGVQCPHLLAAMRSRQEVGCPRVQAIPDARSERAAVGRTQGDTTHYRTHLLLKRCDRRRIVSDLDGQGLTRNPSRAGVGKPFGT